MINDLGRCKIHPTAAHFERLWVFLWPGMTPQPFSTPLVEDLLTVGLESDSLEGGRGTDYRTKQGCFGTMFSCSRP